MWTRNYKNMLFTVCTAMKEGCDGSGNTFGDNYYFNYKDTSGTLREICNFTNGNAYMTYPGLVYGSSSTSGAVKAYVDTITNITAKPAYSPYNLFVGLGSSATEETELDYTLGNEITAFTKNSANGNAVLNTDGTVTITYQVVVTATADITIREIGLFKQVLYAANNSAMRNALINRIVLDSPISVASGEVANVTFSVTTPKITFN